MESCSPNVREDAVESTETAVSTLLSVIGKYKIHFETFLVIWFYIKMMLNYVLVPIIQ